MNLSPDQPLLNEPKLTPAERRAREIEQLRALGLQPKLVLVLQLLLYVNQRHEPAKGLAMSAVRQWE
jgi:hypothetical protein